MIGGGLFGFIGLMIGFGVGADGSFEFGGFGGYEAGGIFFGLIGTVFGSWLIIFFVAEKKYTKYSYVFSSIGCIVAFLINLEFYNYERYVISYFFQLIVPSIIIITTLRLSDPVSRQKLLDYIKKIQKGPQTLQVSILCLTVAIFPRKLEIFCLYIALL